MNSLALIERVSAGLDAYADGDVEVLFGEEILAEAGRLFEILADGADAEIAEKGTWALAWFHWYRHELLPAGEDEGDLNLAVAAFRWLASFGVEDIPEPVLAIVEGDHSHPSVMMTHAHAFLRLYDRTGDDVVFSRAAGLAAAAIERLPSDHPAARQYQWELGRAWVARFHRSGELQDLERAIPLLRKTASALDPGDSLRADFAGILLTYCRLIGKADHELDEAISLLKEALQHAADDHVGGPHLARLGTALWHQYQFTAAIEDLDESIEFSRRAVAGSPDGYPLKAHWMGNLAATVLDRYQHRLRREDLDEAERLSRLALEALSADDSDRARLLNGLGNVLWCGYKASADPRRLDDAIAVQREAVAASDPSDPDYPNYRLGLVGFLNTRSTLFGREADLDEAIRLSREVNAIHTTSDVIRGRALYLLGACLHARFNQIGDRDDLNEAIKVFAFGVESLPKEHPTQVMNLFCHGIALRSRYLLLDNAPDLALSLKHLALAVAGTHAHSPELSSRLIHLGKTYLLGFALVRDPDLLDHAIDYSRQAVELAVASQDELADCQANLGIALLERFRAFREKDDLVEAAALIRQSLEATSDDDPARPRRLLAQADIAEFEFERGGDSRLLRHIHDLAAEAAGIKTSSVSARIRAAKRAAYTAVRKGRVDGAEPADGYRAALPLISAAFDLLPLLAQPGLPKADGWKLMAEAVPPLGGNAAACAEGLGEHTLALQFAEQSRAVIWGQLLDLRTDLTDLRSAHPELAVEIERSRTVLDRSARAAEGPSDPYQIGMEREAKASAARRFDVLVREVRSLPPDPRFPRPREFLRFPPIESLLPPEGAGPVVTLTVSRWQCLALIAESTGVTSVRLPVTSDQIYEQVNKYLFAIQSTGPADAAVQEETTREVLAWAWDAIAFPVLDQLGFLRAAQGPLPRLWWCPTGPLTLLPIHAAGHHAAGDGRSVLDHVVSSYTPTLRVLAEARSRPEVQGDGKLLIAAITQTPKAIAADNSEYSELPGARAEQRFLEHRLGEGRFTSLSDATATHAAVTEGLREHRLAHLSCHGTQDLGFPADAGLVPFDWQQSGLIRITTLAGPDSGGGEFVFLSACQTAAGGTADPDEAVSLAAAMHYAGWKHVVGTLWSVRDDSSAVLAAMLYARIVEDGRIRPARTARALHEAVRALRDEYPTRTSLWARFIHMGP